MAGLRGARGRTPPHALSVDSPAPATRPACLCRDGSGRHWPRGLRPRVRVLLRVQRGHLCSRDRLLHRLHQLVGPGPLPLLPGPALGRTLLGGPLGAVARCRGPTSTWGPGQRPAALRAGAKGLQSMRGGRRARARPLSACPLGGGRAWGPAHTPCLPARSTCSGGRWTCWEAPCPGTCSVLGGAHVATFDEKRYTVHGDCHYVLAKVRARPPDGRLCRCLWGHHAAPDAETSRKAPGLWAGGAGREAGWGPTSSAWGPVLPAL